MVPVENAAGGAALGAHDQAERAPDEHADEVANVKQHGYHKKTGLVYDACIIEQTYHCQQQAPQHQHLVSSFGGCRYVSAQGLVVYFFSDGLEAVCKQLLRAKGQLIFYGDELEDHIHQPYGPEQMQRIEALYKTHAVQNIKRFRTDKTRYGAQYKNQAAPCKTPHILFSHCRHGITLSFSAHDGQKNEIGEAGYSSNLYIVSQMPAKSQRKNANF